MRYLALVGRLLYSVIFLVSGPFHFTAQYAGYAAQAGVPAASVLVPLAGVISLAGALSVLLGYRAKSGAWLLVVFLGPVTLAIHHFWAVKDPMMAQMQQAHFMKNVALPGAALLIHDVGAGRVRVEPRQARATAAGY